MALGEPQPITNAVLDLRLLRHRSEFSGTAAAIAFLAAVATGYWAPVPVRAAYDPSAAVMLPFATGSTVYFNGPHTWAGAGGPWNSLDLQPTPAGQSQNVLAATAGRVHTTECNGKSDYVRIDPSDQNVGWQTTYVHLANRSVSDGAWVNRGDPIGQTGNPPNGCGSGTTIHVHISLWYVPAGGSFNFSQSEGVDWGGVNRLGYDVGNQPVIGDWAWTDGSGEYFGTATNVDTGVSASCNISGGCIGSSNSTVYDDGDIPGSAQTIMPGAIVSWGPGRLDDFSFGSSGPMKHDAVDVGTGWLLDHPDGGALASEPAAVTRGSGVLDVVVQGSANEVYRIDANGTWGGWVDMTGKMDFKASIISGGPNALDIFVTGYPIHHLYHSYWNGGNWSQWEDINNIGSGVVPTSLTSSPVAVAWSSSRIDVFAAGPSGSVVHAGFTGSSWIWDDLGGQIVGAPSVVSRANGLLDIAAQGTSPAHAVYWKGFSGSWGQWTQVAGGLTDYQPTLVIGGPNALDLFASGSPTHHLFHIAWNPTGGWGSTWQDVYTLGGGSPTLFESSPAAVAWSSSRLDATGFVTVNGSLERTHAALSGGSWIWDQLPWN